MLHFEKLLSKLCFKDSFLNYLIHLTIMASESAYMYTHKTSKKQPCHVSMTSLLLNIKIIHTSIPENENLLKSNVSNMGGTKKCRLMFKIIAPAYKVLRFLLCNAPMVRGVLSVIVVSQSIDIKHIHPLHPGNLILAWLVFVFS